MVDLSWQTSRFGWMSRLRQGICSLLALGIFVAAALIVSLGLLVPYVRDAALLLYASPPVLSCSGLICIGVSVGALGTALIAALLFREPLPRHQAPSAVESPYGKLNPRAFWCFLGGTIFGTPIVLSLAWWTL